MSQTLRVFLGALVMSQSQIATTFTLDALSPAWYDLAGTGLVGVYINAIIDASLGVYITTFDAANPATSGLFYTPSIDCILDGDPIVWTLLKSVNDAVSDTGYSSSDDCQFGSLYVYQDQVMVLVHSRGNKRPNAPGTAVYLGSDGSVTPYNLPAYEGANYFHQETPVNDTNLCVYGDIDGWAIAGKIYKLPNNKPYLIRGDPVGGWAETSFAGIGGGARLVAVHNGYVVAQGAQLYENYDPAQQVDGISVFQAAGVCSDGTDYLYLDHDTENLHRSGVLIGDADAVLGTQGGMAIYGLDAQSIAWVARGVASSPGAILAYSENNGSTWADKTGDLYTVLGGNWAGGNGSTGAIVRLFESTLDAYVLSLHERGLGLNLVERPLELSLADRGLTLNVPPKPLEVA